MSVKFEQALRNNGITVSEIIDKKFKSNAIVMRFITPLSEQTAAANSLIVDLLSTSNSKYPTREALIEQLAELYGSTLNAFSYRIADYQVFGLSINFIGDDYAIDNECVSEKAADIMLDCIFSPQLENGFFSEKYFMLRKQELIDSIQSSVNNKRQYAMIKACAQIFEGEPYSVSSLGTLETAEQLTLDDMNAAYERLLHETDVNISFCGGNDFNAVRKKLLDRFSAVRNAPQQPVFLSPSPLKDEVRYSELALDVKQCKMVMAFKTSNSNIYANKIMCALFGGSPISKLFLNVREKLSLCYYCSSGIIEGKNTMIVDSGLDEDKLSVARNEIISQLEALQNGDFSDEELENIKLYVIGAFRSNYDSVADMNSWYFYQFVRGTSYSPDEVADIISRLTRQDIIDSAKAFQLDTVFTLKPDNGGDKQ